MDTVTFRVFIVVLLIVVKERSVSRQELAVHKMVSDPTYSFVSLVKSRFIS